MEIRHGFHAEHKNITKHRFLVILLNKKYTFRALLARISCIFILRSVVHVLAANAREHLAATTQAGLRARRTYNARSGRQGRTSSVSGESSC